MIKEFKELNKDFEKNSLRYEKDLQIFKEKQKKLNKNFEKNKLRFENDLQILKEKKKKWA